MAMAIQQIQQKEQAEQVDKGQLERRLFTIDEYERMIEAGILEEDEHLELIRGEIVRMPPIGFEHGFGLAYLNRVFSRLVASGDRALVWLQSPISITPNSRLEPDVVLLRPRPDLSPKSPPTSADVILLVEVAQSSVRYDRNVKRELYAQAGIPEYWIVNLQNNVIEVYSEPVEGIYKKIKQAKRGDTLTLPADLGAVEVNEILGK